MRHEITENEMDQVVGGVVCISESRMLIKFTDLNCETYPLKCTYNQANILALTLYEQYGSSTTAQEFENIVKQEFINHGWI